MIMMPSCPRSSRPDATCGQVRTSSPLPSSGDEQLDKYLAYLLSDANPHKYLHYR
jgi:hypothetical protein